MEPSSQMFTQGGIRTRDWFSERLPVEVRQRQRWETREVRQEERGRTKAGVGRSYLLRALHISMVTSTDKAMVMGSGASKISHSTPSKSGLSSVHCMK